MTRPRLPSRLVASAVALVVLSLAVPSFAAAASDLEVTGAILERNGAERLVRFTFTNLGPDPADARDYDDTGLHTYFAFSYQAFDTQLLSESRSCYLRDDGSGQRLCEVGDYVPAGASHILDLRLRVTGQYPNVAVGLDSLNWDPTNDPNDQNEGTVLFLNETAGCDVTAKSPQAATSRGIRVTVRAPADRGCVAALSSATVKLGGSKYVFVKSRPTRTLAAGQTWNIRLPFGKTFLGAIRRALQKRKVVNAKAGFNIDGATRSVEVRLK